MPKFSSISRESCVIGGMFSALCVIAGMYAWFEWPSVPSSAPPIAEPAKEIDDLKEVARLTEDTRTIAEANRIAFEDASKAIGEAKEHKTREDMESWWRYHQIETWWKLRHQQAAQRRPEHRRIAPKPAISDAVLAAVIAERTWSLPPGMTATSYEPPRYLTDTSRWPLHGPGSKNAGE